MSTYEIMQSVIPSFETTVHVRDTCLCLHVQRAERTLSRCFDIALKPAGLTSGQFSLLMSLNRPAPPKLGSVASLLAMDRTTLTANLKPLQRRGLVETVADQKDKRARLLRLTSAGRIILAEVMPKWRQVHAEVEAALSDPNRLRAELNLLSGIDDHGAVAKEMSFGSRRGY